MIRRAADAGATIAKFQLGHANPDVWCSGTVTVDPDYRAQRARYAPNKWATELAQWCEYYGVEFLASCFSKDSLNTARAVGMRRRKIPTLAAHNRHGSWHYNDYLGACIADNVEIFMSGGLSVLKWARIRDKITPLYCTALYPTYPEDISIPPVFGGTGNWFGLSSHAHGYEDALLAVARGATVIEKHVSLDKTEESIRDNHFALSFEEFAEMVRVGDKIARIA